MRTAERPEPYRRRSVRLRGHDYCGGVYFVTVCTAGRRRVFGRVEDGQMRLSEIGRIADREWRRTPCIRTEVSIDAFVVMPDHVHLLFALDGGATINCRGVSRYAPTPPDLGVPPGPNGDRTFASPSRSVGAVIRGYKGAVTAAVNRHRGVPGHAVWQRGYHDRVVRTAREAEAVRRYIAENPTRWG